MPTADDAEIAELRALMAKHDLLPDLPASHRPDPDQAERTLQRLLATGSPHRGRRGVRWVAAVAAVVLGGAGAWTLTVGSTPAAAFPPPLTYSLAEVGHLDQAPGATSVLLALADTAQGAVPAGEGDYQSVSTHGWLLAIDDAEVRTIEVAVTRTDFHLAPDGSARIDQTRGPALDLNGRLKPASEALPGHTDTSDTIPAGVFDAQLAATLPRDPADLREALLTRMEGFVCTTPAQQTFCLVNEITQLSAMYVIPGDLAAGFWRVLAAEPFVYDLGDTKDRLGRPARAIAVPEPPHHEGARLQVLLVSPGTGMLAGTEDVTLRDTGLGITSPTVTGFQTWLDARFTTTLG